MADIRSPACLVHSPHGDLLSTGAIAVGMVLSCYVCWSITCRNVGVNTWQAPPKTEPKSRAGIADHLDPDTGFDHSFNVCSLGFQRDGTGGAVALSLNKRSVSLYHFCRKGNSRGSRAYSLTMRVR